MVTFIEGSAQCRRRVRGLSLGNCSIFIMDEEARAHRRRELDERKKKLEKMRAQKATRSKTAEVSIKVTNRWTYYSNTFIIANPIQSSLTSQLLPWNECIHRRSKQPKKLLIRLCCKLFSVKLKKRPKLLLPRHRCPRPRLLSRAAVMIAVVALT